MRNRIISIGIMMFMIVQILCKKETAEKEVSTPNKNDTLTAAPDFPAVVSCLLDDMNRLGKTDDRLLMRKMSRDSWDSASGSFFCLGRGVVNSNLPAGARSAAREKAAELTALSWALYCRRWRNGEYVPVTDTVNGRITYSNKVYEHVSGDTLYALYQIPLGSIVD